MKKISLLSLFVFGSVAVLPFSANAQIFAEPYIGLGYGQYKFEFHDDDVDTDFDGDDDVVKAFVGTKFNDVIGGELTYLSFGDAKDGDLNTELEGFSLAAVFLAPLSERFNIFGKLGWFSWEADVRINIGNVQLSDSADGDDLFYGAGLRFDVSEHIGLRAEYDRYEIDDDIDPELDALSASIEFLF